MTGVMRFKVHMCTVQDVAIPPWICVTQMSVSMLYHNECQRAWLVLLLEQHCISSAGS